MLNAERLTRRGLLQRVKSATIAVAVAPVVVALEGCQASFDDKKFFTDIEKLPLNEQLQKVESTYGQYTLKREVFEQHVLSLWVRGYIQNSGSKLTEDEIRSKLQILEDPTAPGQEPDPGGIDLNPVSRKKGPIKFNLGAYSSNQSYPNGSDKGSGISFMRSAFVSTLIDYDAAYKDDLILGSVINNHNIINPPLQNPGSLIVNGFSFFERIPPNYATFFVRFDEVAADVVQSFISDKEGLPVVLASPYASALRDLLRWIQYPPNQMISQHQESNLEGFASSLGQISQFQTKAPIVPGDKNLADGLTIMELFEQQTEKPNFQQFGQVIDRYFPGFFKVMTANPPRLVRQPNT